MRVRAACRSVVHAKALFLMEREERLCVPVLMWHGGGSLQVEMHPKTLTVSRAGVTCPAPSLQASEISIVLYGKATSLVCWHACLTY